MWQAWIPYLAAQAERVRALLVPRMHAARRRIPAAYRRYVMFINGLVPRRRYRRRVSVASFAISALLIIGAVLYASMPDWEETDQIWNLKEQHSITFTDRNGNLLGHRGGSMDTSFAIGDYPPVLVKAVLATEDQRFYSHWGIDPIGIAGAIAHNVTHPESRDKGGSTITQQVVKNMWLTPERTLGRKIKEAWLSLWLENRLSKDEILRMYFERSYLGAGNYGLAAASRYYFGKPVTDLSIPEAAMLAGLFKAPVNYNPAVNPEAARRRTAVVLGRMLDEGVIDRQTHDWALAHPATIVKHDPSTNEWALDFAYMEAMRIIQHEGLTRHRSFKVRTTIDLGLQAEAERVVSAAIDQQGGKYGVTQGALVSMGVDGSIRSIVGGADYQQSQFNRAASARRQPGSSFKPFVYLTALMHGWRPSTRVVDGPVTLNVFGKPWTPTNYGDKYFGNVTLAEALQRSLNTVAVKIMLQFGRQNIAEVARNAGIRSEIKTVASMPLGSNEVTLLELTGAYTTFASGGQHQEPWVVSSISVDDVAVYNHWEEQNLSMIFPKQAILDIVQMMHGVVEHGTATKAKLRVPVAGKTGTTSDYNDAWFVGFTGNLVTGVWFGNDDNSKTNRMTGGTLPAEVWHDYMNTAESREPGRGIPGIPYVAPGPPDQWTVMEPRPTKKKAKPAAPPPVDEPQADEPVQQEVQDPPVKRKKNIFELLFGGRD